MGGGKCSRAKQVCSSEKENLPPTKTRRAISVSGLFDTKRYPRNRSEKNAGDVLAPKSAGVLKRATTKSRPSAQSRKSKKALDHPLYRSFAETANGYRKVAEGYIVQQLEPAYNMLVARVEGLGINGEPLAETHMPTTADMETAIQCESELSKPLEEQTFTVRKLNNETMKAELGQLMHVFENILEQKRTVLQGLSKELRQVHVEIAAAYKDVLDTENGAVKKERLQLDKDLAALTQEAYKARELTMVEVKQAREDEHAAAADEKRRLDAFMNSLE